MTNYKNFIISVGYLFIISCGSNSDQSSISHQEVDTYKIDVNESQFFEWPGDLIVDDIIYLQTDEASLIASLNKLVVSPDRGKYYVIDTKSKRVLQFDQSGKKIMLFDKHGPGPEEYLQMLDVHINFQSETIEILEYRKIQVYSLKNFDYLRTISLMDIEGDINYVNLISIDSIYYLWTPIPANQRLDLIQMSEYNRYHLIRKSGNEIDYFFPYQYGVVLDDKFYQTAVEGEYNLSPNLGSNTIYRVTKDGIYPKVNFPFSSNNPPTEVLESYIGNEIEFVYNKYYKNITNIRETNGYIYFMYYGEGIVLSTLFNTSNKKFVSTGNMKEFYIRMIASDSKYFYCYIFPTVLNDIKSRSALENHPLLKDLDYTKFEIDDNPIIIKFHIPSSE